MKITPAHDFNDFEVGRRHDLPMPSVLDKQAHVTLAEIDDVLARSRASPIRRSCAGWTGRTGSPRASAIVAELERLELVEKIEPHTIRCRTATAAACRSSRC